MLQAWRLRDDDRLVAWSLGNFVFDRMEGASRTGILSLTLTADGVRDARLIPVRMVDGLPRPA